MNDSWGIQIKNITKPQSVIVSDVVSGGLCEEGGVSFCLRENKTKKKSELGESMNFFVG